MNSLNNLPVIEKLPLQKKLTIKDIEKALKFYVIPLATVLGFLMVVVLLIIPKITLIFDNLGVISKYEEGNSKLKTELEELKKLSAKSVDIDNKLEIVNSIAPTGVTEVVSFRDRITKLSLDAGLQVNSQRFSELDVRDDVEDNAINLLALQEVPVDFEIAGTFENITQFLTSLSQIEDFIVVTEMSLSTKDEGLWSLSMRISRYQFNKITDQVVIDAFKNINPNASLNKSMEEYLNNRGI